MKKIIGLVMVMAMLLSMTALASGLAAFEKTDRFDVMETEKGLSLISRDGELVIHVGGGTEIIFEDGTDAIGRLEAGQTLAQLLDGRKLTVSYSITTRSIPPQTTPEKIVIHYETIVPLPAYGDGNALIGIVPPIYEFSPEEIEKLFPLNGEIAVNGDIIEAPAPYYANGVVMIPLRAVAQAIGFDVAWDSEIKGVRLGTAINLWIGRDYYIIGKMAPIKLVAAPEITDGHTYVPFTFIREIARNYDIYVFEGQVVVEAVPV